MRVALMRTPWAVVAIGAAAALALGQDAVGPRPETPEEARLLARANLYRAGVDLAPLVRDEACSTACLRHAEYMDRNNAPDHDEDPNLPGYTKEGAAAGIASVLAFTGPEDSVDMWQDSFLHRIPIISPDGARAGVAWLAGKAVTSAVLDTETKKDQTRNGDRVILWPPVDMVGVPTQMSSEQPNPTPYPDSSQAGYPVTVSFHPARKVTKASARLLLGMEPVRCFFSSPDQPTKLGVAYQQNTITLIPEKTLPHGKVFRAEFSCEVDGKPWTQAWAFKTGNRRDGFAWIEKRRAEAEARAAVADRERRKGDAVAIDEAKRGLRLAAQVLKIAPERAEVVALADGRKALAAVPESGRGELAGDIAALEKLIASVEERLAAAVKGALAEIDRLSAAGQPDEAKAVLDRIVLRVKGHPTHEAALGVAGARAGTSAATQAATVPLPTGWKVLLVDRVTDDWMLPDAPEDHLRSEGGAVVLDAKQVAAALAYAKGDRWTDWELSAEVEVTGGGVLWIRSMLAEGASGDFFYLAQTPPGAFTPLLVTVTGDRIAVKCGAQALEKRASTRTGSIIFHAEKGNRIRIRNVRVRVAEPGAR